MMGYTYKQLLIAANFKIENKDKEIARLHTIIKELKSKLKE